MMYKILDSSLSRILELIYLGYLRIWVKGYIRINGGKVVY